ncbi:MAG: (d)CMP kinase [bacterium]
MIYPLVAIDGPAASGKSAVAKRLAELLRFVYVDTGAMYRAFTWLTMEKGNDPSSRPAMKKLLAETRFEMEITNGAATLSVNGVNPASFLREERVHQTVSQVASLPELREFLVNKQRQLRCRAPLVMEGRDIGTVVATDTPYKFFLDADPAVREARRQKQGEADSPSKRDARDSTDPNRVAATLIRAADAERVDTSNMTIEEVVQHIYNSALQRGLKPRV